MAAAGSRIASHVHRLPLKGAIEAATHRRWAKLFRAEYEEMVDCLTDEEREGPLKLDCEQLDDRFYRWQLPSRESHAVAMATFFADEDFDEFNIILRNILHVYMKSSYELYRKTKVDEGHIFFWGTVLEHGQHKGVHNHMHTLCSGTYYLSLPENSSPIVFTTDDEEYRIMPNEQDLLIYPNWLMQEVPPGENTEPRISLNFTLSDEAYMLNFGNQRGDSALGYDVTSR